VLIVYFIDKLVTVKHNCTLLT